ncbi:hypothetical protein [Clostridium sporogenes]|uniref:hypothetical protein n=1 Tax=Clostridium sporogenes TaxID=1509 RepID=UPI0007175842|nr:hypothetical protein [Clostridium sporogenes]KRU39999.1 hypothetical protein VT94_24760 [Clostridium sporogenes]MBY7065184.1 hypothetical protein [Clostridium sporogenes]MBY7071846.1 hypothetical protein [Clostridium sporogenes]MCW6064746.1 hypothetical protein [Clostridium sporogenes]OQP88527.1 hypothetical protein VT93_0201710 [Clostridium sporogenes]
MLEIATKGKREVRGIYKNKNHVHWISNNLIESYGNMCTGKTYLTINEIIEKGLEGEILLLRDQYGWDNENMSDKERLESSIYPKDVRCFNIKTLQLSNLNIIDDVLEVYKQYKYIIFDELRVDEKYSFKLLEKIYELSEKYKDVLFLWIGQLPINEEFKVNNNFKLNNKKGDRIYVSK